MRHLSLLLLATGAAHAAAQETPPRPLTPTAIRLKASVATISGVRELRGGKLLVSDATRAAVYLVDPAGGSETLIGSAGGDELQYAQPGGFYSAPGDTTLLLDRGLSKALVIAPNGSIVGARSIKRRGVTGSSSDDVDHQRLDGRALAYFTTRDRVSPGRAGERKVDSSALVRFDAARQHYDTVTFIRGQESRVVKADEHIQMTQVVSGSPADDWGVLPDGRVVVVRGSPYRVEWHGTDGRVTRGPPYRIPAIAFTPAEKDSIIARAKRSGGSVGMVGGPSMSAADATFQFADSKAAFAPNDVIVSPNGQVWVARTQPFGSTGTTYDIFNQAGDRVDRVLLAGRARVVGFGNGVAYAMIRGVNGEVSLARYKP